MLPVIELWVVLASGIGARYALAAVARTTR
jgi:hypothetical protein